MILVTFPRFLVGKGFFVLEWKDDKQMTIKINEYKLPMDKLGPYGITVGPDGAMWFTE